MTQKPVFMEGIFTLRNLRSMSAAALVELLIAFGIAAVLVWQEVRPVEQPQLPPQPIVDPYQLPPVPQQPQVPVPEQPHFQRATEVPPIPTDVPGPNVQPLQPLQPPYLPPQQPPAGLVDEFAGRVLRAIDAAKVYPKNEMLKGHTGEAVVSFDYTDGLVSDIHVDKSTGFRDLDLAAIDAVKRAVLPAKPAELAGLTHFVFQLSFDLND